MSTQPIKSTGCCEPFNPEPWQEKEITWKDKLFVKDQVTSFLHIPLNMGKKIVKNLALIEKSFRKILFESDFCISANWFNNKTAKSRLTDNRLKIIF